MSKEYDVFMTENAERDLNEIILYIAQDNIDIALTIYDRLKTKVLSLKTFPEKGRVVPELLDQHIKDYRELIEAPWRIMYKIDGRIVTVLTILDGRRNISDVLTMKLLQ